MSIITFVVNIPIINHILFSLISFYFQLTMRMVHSPSMLSKMIMLKDFKVFDDNTIALIVHRAQKSKHYCSHLGLPY